MKKSHLIGLGVGTLAASALAATVLPITFAAAGQSSIAMPPVQQTSSVQADPTDTPDTPGAVDKQDGKDATDRPDAPGAVDQKDAKDAVDTPDVPGAVDKQDGKDDGQKDGNDHKDQNEPAGQEVNDGE